MKQVSNIVITVFGLWLSSCSVSKFIPEDEVLYTGASVNLNFPEKVKNKGAIREQVSGVLYPKPNSELLGMKLGLYYHYRAEKKNFAPVTKWLNKKFGEEPVYLSDVDVAKTEELIGNRLENNGFFKNTVTAEMRGKGKYASIRYDAEMEIPYKLKAYQLDKDSSQIHRDLKAALEKTLLKPESRFDLSQLKAERQRIDEYLKSLGYYNFNGDFLLFEADTNQYDTRHFDLFLRLKKETPLRSKLPYRINSIQIYPRYSLNEDSLVQDTVVVDELEIIQRGTYFKPHLLPYYVLLEEDTRYNPRASRVTSQRFSSIGSYKYVNIRHEVIKTPTAEDSVGWVNTQIFLSPTTKRSLRAEIQGVTKSNNFAGPSLLGTYLNRNLFHGGEILQVSGKVGYETQITGGKNSGLSSTQFGINSDLIFPRLIPIKLVDRFQYDVPKTKVSLGMEYLNRSKLYTLRTFSLTQGYTWNASKYIYHELDPISINLVKLSNTTEEFDAILADNPFLAGSFEQEFIAGMNYSFTYSEMNNSAIKNPFFLNANLNVAGNAMNALSSDTNAEGKQTIFNQEFAQYAKIDMDARFHLDLGKGHQLVSRVFAGFGMAYGNSDALPFAKQYYAGGPYSIRAFQIRGLGPGTYTPQQDDDNTSSFFDRTGDVRLEGNVEYRFPIYSVLKGGLFVDAGNVWLREGDEEALPGGQFTSSFYKQLGIGTGAGLRVDIQSFVIRGDLAFPIHHPTTGFDVDLSGLTFNFAIGYPF
ncbi:BamA/TamA family outer membrane protein [Marinoscillum sp.]|uniref:translocation and assembly module lipoprotein TamL n=1 Tax=Marinoscillum sp. TaxID=2024838 RepID=UPI003BAA58D5